MREEEEVRESCPKVRAIDVGLSGTLRVKNVLQRKNNAKDSISENTFHVTSCKRTEGPT